jgi:hypothetical protein
MDLILTDQAAKLLVMEEAAQARANHIKEIQKFASAAIGPDDVHVFGMRIVNSKPASFYGQFPPDALTTVAEMLPGRPVMVGHNYDTAPVGRFFAAQRVFKPETPTTPRAESYWVEALFYMLKGDPEGDAMARKIEAGIASEVSLGWAFRKAECSICKNDVRSNACMHQPGEVYEDGGMAVFMMNGVTEVLEGSVVYAGAERGTHFFKASRGERVPVNAVLASTLAATKAADLAGAEDDDSIDGLFTAAPRRAPEPVRGIVQTLVCSLDRFAGADDAKRWARQHSFTADTMQTEGDGFYFTQFAASADAGDVKRIHIASGVSGIIVKPRKTSGEAQASLTDLLAS